MSGGRTAVPARGDVVLASVPFADGSGSKLRPLVVVQADALNRSIGNVVVAQVTGNTRRAGHVSQLLVDVTTPEGRATGLLTNSAVTAENLSTLAQSCIVRTIGRLSGPLTAQLDDCLRVALDLP